jgi:hypothetical protein
MSDCINLQLYSEFIRTNLKGLFEILVLPLIQITQEDVDEYEGQPETYIKNDLEESDAEDTKKRNCMKFVQ